MGLLTVGDAFLLSFLFLIEGYKDVLYEKKIISYTFGKQTPHIMLLSLSVSACDIFYNYNINHWKLFNRVKGKVVIEKKKKKTFKS